MLTNTVITGVWISSLRLKKQWQEGSVYTGTWFYYSIYWMKCEMCWKIWLNVCYYFHNVQFLQWEELSETFHYYLPSIYTDVKRFADGSATDSLILFRYWWTPSSRLHCNMRVYLWVTETPFWEIFSSAMIISICMLSPINRYERKKIVCCANLIGSR